jgi:hypothetical protein
MLEQFVESKIKIERSRIDKYDDITKTDIKKSRLPSPIKRYILARFDGKLTDSEFSTLLTKAIKLNINYTIRPKWTLLNFLFNKYDSQQAEVLKEKTDIFTYYRFYIDFLINYIDEHSLVVITKDKAALFIDEANKALHEKLVNNISGVKVKNFFIQLYRLSEEDQSNVSLTSTVPFLFIKTFLEDKDYSDILAKFTAAGITDNETEITLKDCIKIVSDKFAPAATEKSEEETEPSRLEQNSEETGEEVVVVFPDTESEVNEVTMADEEESGEETGLINSEENTDDVIVVDFRKWEEEVDKITDDRDRGNEEKEIIEDDSNDNIQDEPVVNDQTIKEEVDLTETFDPASEEAQYEVETDEGKLPTEVIEESNLDIEKKSISRLFKQNELANICESVYRSDKHMMHESFRTLKGFDNWKEASEYLKEHFYDKDIDIYNKHVLMFVDVLEDYFKQRGK